jgi:hypothetical protein
MTTGPLNSEPWGTDARRLLHCVNSSFRCSVEPMARFVVGAQHRHYNNLVRAIAFTLLLLPVLSAFGQTYSIDWSTIDGGGGTSTGGVYSVSGSIGQPDASGAMTGGNYSLTGGFWSLVSVVQTAGAPTLCISHSGSLVTLWWQNTGNWALQQNSNLNAPAGWGTCGGVVTVNGTNYLSVNNPSGSLFFRLKQ